MWHVFWVILQGFCSEHTVPCLLHDWCVERLWWNLRPHPLQHGIWSQFPMTQVRLSHPTARTVCLDERYVPRRATAFFPQCASSTPPRTRLAAQVGCTPNLARGRVLADAATAFLARAVFLWWWLIRNGIFLSTAAVVQNPMLPCWWHTRIQHGNGGNAGVIVTSPSITWSIFFFCLFIWAGTGFWGWGIRLCHGATDCRRNTLSPSSCLDSVLTWAVFSPF